MMLSHPTITGLMQRLEGKDFIRRINNPQDGRCKFIALTEKGEEIEKALKKNIREMEGKALDGITADELVVLDRCLRTIADNLKIEDKPTRAKRN